ncbi:MAG: cyclase family protein [Acidobacteriota bacterium]|nr:cyclase family protein [Acidobacteriota bacterium]
MLTTYSLLDWIDISVALYPGMPHWPGNTPFEIAKDHDMALGDHDNVSRISMGVHTGTHMDAPLHFLANGVAIDTMPFQATVGRARVIEIENPETISVPELQSHDLEPGERLLFKTQNSSRSWPTQPFFADFVYIPHEAAEFLAERQVRTVGVDYLSVGGYKKDGAQTHSALLNAGIWIIEGLNLAAVAPGHYDLVCLPLLLAGVEAAPARAILRRER